MSSGTGFAQISQPNEREGTRLENFTPIAGSVVILAYDLLGEISGISVQPREIMADKGGYATGVLVTVTESEHRSQNVFIDADELPELLKGFDAILEVQSNKTSFSFFEVKYETKGHFELIAFNNRRGNISYGVTAGRGMPARVLNLAPDHMKSLKNLFAKALEKLSNLSNEARKF